MNQRIINYEFRIKLNFLNASDAAEISEEIIKEKIEGADLIYVDGGNTFYLQRHIIESSFWAAIDSHLTEGS